MNTAIFIFLFIRHTLLHFCLRQKAFGSTLQIDLTLSEPFGICRAALIAAVSRGCTYHIGKINTVMFFHPYDLTFMAFQHFDFKFHLFRDIHVLGRIEIYSGKRIRIINQHKKMVKSSIPLHLTIFCYSAFSIFSIAIPYPLVGSFRKTWVTAPTSLPFCTIGLPLIP